MARKARQRAESGVYYVRIDSADKLIFIDDADGQVFLSQLEAAARDDFADLYAYCLLNEHIHLVVKEGLAGISPMLQRTLSAYTLTYNKRYDREGKLFYDRFKSMPLEETADILDAVRYVHRLPLPLVGKLRYPFSSYARYLRGDMGEEIVMAAGGMTAFKEYTDAPTAFVGFDRVQISDEDLTIAARNLLEGYTQQRLEAEYDDVLRKLLAIEGTTVGQLCRVLNISRRRLERVAKEKN